MRARTVYAAIFLCIFSRPLVAESQVMVPSIIGRVFVDGRPLERIVEIRLEAHNSATVAAAFTLDAPRFIFRNVSMTLDDTYFLVIREPGFKELRQQLYRENFVQDSAYASVAHFTGILILNLERLPPENREADDPKMGPKTVDVRQLQAKIPDEARREYNAALEDLSTDDGRAALTHLERAVELAPEYYAALNTLGAEYIRFGQLREAEAVLYRACRLNPNDPLPLTNLGILRLKEAEKPASSSSAGETGVGVEAVQSFYRMAVDLFEKALRLDPLNPQTNFHLGTALYKVGAYERAESVLLHCLALNDQSHEARLTLVNLYTRQMRYEAALKQISAYLEANPDSPRRDQVEALRIQIERALIRQ